jgi:hypothetical protein
LKVESFLLGVVLLLPVAGFSQELINESHLPKLIQTEKDLTFWHSIGFNYVQEDYQINNKFTRYLSNNILSYSLGFEYSAFCLSLSFPINVTLMKRKYPVSSNFDMSVIFVLKGIVFSARIANTKGFYNVTDIHNFTENIDFDSLYRGDMSRFFTRINAYYYFNPKFRYTEAMNSTYYMQESGYTFWTGGKMMYHQFINDSTFFIHPDFNFDGLNDKFSTLRDFSTAVKVGFSGVLASKNWFLEGQIGIGANIQVQMMKYQVRKTRLMVQPDLDMMFSVGYKTKGLIVAIEFPVEVMFNFMRKKDLLIENNLCVNLRMGFNISDMLKRHK